MKRVLVANRGEIAVRIIRAAHDLGLEAVAVYSEADRAAPHVRMADEAVEIGPPPAGKSYLDMSAIVEAARTSGADGVHPGYGFLAERADFASTVEGADLRYVGPKPEHIALMGDKARARAAAEDVGVPTIPGSDGAVTDADEAADVAGEIGYPVALKAAGGGGGRGIRIVHDEATLHSRYKTAGREAAGAFDDARVYVERFITPARHVEVQVLGDGARAIHLHERDCSLQRRRQKVVEETPAPRLAEATRVGLQEAAIALCAEIGYRSAGTVEFLVDASSDEFFFIEMNTRIQVEHPVTETITGVDLIAEQLRIAAGEPLGLRQEDVAPHGCAIELRINAEDPANNFMPSPGPLHRVVLPAGPWVRVDTWMEPGGEVPPFYDSLLGKVIVWGPDRGSAVARARRALRELEVEGVKTTKPLLATLLAEDWFAEGEFNTDTLEAWLEATTNGSAKG
ncbi:MAG TPA: acetyl-CoA carboxylase biotin carboxylase subunit [Solirubrobacteraceae bacterium]|nr:acetyl-CoA carboxylase biotin carboxylase subunit [Solirubrobacteraceae bacterium]